MEVPPRTIIRGSAPGCPEILCTRTPDTVPCKAEAAFA